MVPEEHKKGFQVLLSRPADELQRLLDQIKAAAPAAYFFDLAKRLAEQSNFVFDDIYSLLRLSADLSDFRFEYELSVEDLLPGVFQSVSEDEELASRWQQADKQFLERVLRELVQAPAIEITSKAVEVLADSERRLCADNCRIVSNIHPVFPRTNVEQPAAAVVGHLLKIAYHHDSGDDVGEFYVSLDTDDILHLKELLERASLKEKALKSVIKRAGIVYLNGIAKRDRNDRSATES